MEKRKFRSYEEARTFVRKLGLKSQTDWRAYRKSGKRPDDIPSNPQSTYGSAFKGYGDWLGTSTVAPQNRKFRPFAEAREFVRQLGLKNQRAWQAYCASGEKPDDIPSLPNKTYVSEFMGYGDWIGTGSVRPRDRQYCSFTEARNFVHQLKLKGSAEWQTYCKSGKKPENIPSDPRGVYKSEFKSMGDWLGTGSIANQNREFQSFVEARDFVHKLQLKKTAEWESYCKSGKKPDDIPYTPQRVYRFEYKGMGDWLGTGNTHPRNRQYRSFEEARDFVHKQRLKNQTEWQTYFKSGAKPKDIPSYPEQTYSAEFKGYGDWLGTGYVTPRNRKYHSFSEARDFVRGLRLKGQNDWRAYCKSGEKPKDIPSNPQLVYSSEFVSYGDWLGTGNTHPRNRQYRSFSEARDFVHRLGLKNWAEWQAYSKSDQKPQDIPASPHSTYKSEFKSVGDWLGTGYIHPSDRQYRSFSEARAFVHKLNLKSRAEWQAYCKSGEKPDDIPSNPQHPYRTEFKSYGDWLGTGNVKPGARQYRPFAEARDFVCKLMLKNYEEWRFYSKSGKKPHDIPSSPNQVYGSEFRGYGDWLGTRTVAPFNRQFRPFLEARNFVHQLKLKSSAEWQTYSKSGKKPENIPSNPGSTYGSEFVSMGDWLGTGYVATYDRKFRAFAEAREFVRQLKLRGQREWQAYCRSGQKPDDIPSNPAGAYSSEFEGYGDWLGTGNVAMRDRKYRSFSEAREFVRKLGLKDWGEWQTYCKSGKKPADIPADPRYKYKSEFKSSGDWLGTGSVGPGNREFRPFPEARDFARTLGLKNQGEWQAYSKSGKRPLDVPASPMSTYVDEFKGYGDWLGVVNKWTKVALLALLQDLRPRLPHLEERELYVILQQGGTLPALQVALGVTSPMRVLKDLKYNDGKGLGQAIRGTSDDEIATRVDEYLTDDAVTQEGGPASLLAGMAFDSGEVNNADASLGVDLPTLATNEGLRVIDTLAGLSCGLDDEAAEYLVTNRVSALWERYISEGRAIVDELLAGDGGRWFAEIKTRFLSEVEGVENLVIPAGWAFAVNGKLELPNAMQRRAAWAVREKRRVGNWSGVGAGKTLSAVLASRAIDARVTLIVTNNATVNGWGQQIKQAYPDSVVHTHVDDDTTLDRERNYVVLNYEKFQNQGRDHLVHLLLGLGVDFIVFDEVQFVKQRDEKASKRRKALEALVCGAAENNPDLRVLGMSATPVINNLLEAKKLLEIVTGVQFSELDTSATVNNALAMHRALMLHGFRYRPPYEQEMHTEIVTTVDNDLLESIRNVGSDVLSVEQILLPVKLKAVREHFRKGTIVYTYYVDGMLAPIRRYLEEMGFRVGLYTGTDKSGLEPFLKGSVDILVGSSPVGTGLDGLQKVCDRLIMLCLPWTGAEYEQIIGRIRRQGSIFSEVGIIVPQVTLDYQGDTWSWDQGRMACIQYKRTLSDCAVDGHIPETVRINQNELLKQSREALERWIERIGVDGILATQRERLTVPLPLDVRHAAVVRHGDFTVLNRQWNTSHSTTTHERLQKDPSEWYLYHTLYRESRQNWPEQPFERIAERIRVRPDWIVGDFGCGECPLAQALPNRVIGLDHVACDENVIACDMSSTPLEDASLDVAVFSLSLMGGNWIDYLKEAYRTLKPYGHLFIAEPQGRWQDRIEELKNAIEAAGFRTVGNVEQRYDFIYFTAVKV